MIDFARFAPQDPSLSHTRRLPCLLLSDMCLTCRGRYIRSRELTPMSVYSYSLSTNASLLTGLNRLFI